MSDAKMVFTDENVREFKELCEFRGWHEGFTNNLVRALLARLAAAEEIKKVTDQIVTMGWNDLTIGLLRDAVKAWRRACGKGE